MPSNSGRIGNQPSNASDSPGSMKGKPFIDGEEWVTRVHPSIVKSGDRLQVLWEAEKDDVTVIEEWYEAKIFKVKPSGKHPHQIVYLQDGCKEWVNVSSRMCKSASFNERMLRWHRTTFKSTTPKHKAETGGKKPLEPLEKSKGARCNQPSGPSGKAVQNPGDEDAAPCEFTGDVLQVQLQQPQETTADVRQSLVFVGSLMNSLEEVQEKEMQPEVSVTSLDATTIPTNVVGEKRKHRGKLKDATAPDTAQMKGGSKQESTHEILPKSEKKAKTPRTPRAQDGSKTLPNVNAASTAPVPEEKQKSNRTRKVKATDVASDTEQAAKTQIESEDEEDDEDDEDDDVFLVEKVMASKKTKGKILFLVKWLGYPESQNTWEPSENLEGCEYLKDFLSPPKNTPSK